MTREEDGRGPEPSGLQDGRVRRLSGSRRRPDRCHRRAGSRRLQARAVRHHLRQGQDDAARPDRKAATVGMRKLAEGNVVKKALDTLTGRARIKRTMWSRRAQEYEAKINSGDLISIAEVVRDLYRSEQQPEQSYSERQLYEPALDRMAREVAAVEDLTRPRRSSSSRASSPRVRAAAARPRMPPTSTPRWMPRPKPPDSAGPRPGRPGRQDLACKDLACKDLACKSWVERQLLRKTTRLGSQVPVARHGSSPIQRARRDAGPVVVLGRALRRARCRLQARRCAGPDFGFGAPASNRRHFPETRALARGRAPITPRFAAFAGRNRPSPPRCDNMSQWQNPACARWQGRRRTLPMPPNSRLE